jgi:hypothetical protein
VGVYCGPQSCRDITENGSMGGPAAGPPIGIEAHGSFATSEGIVLASAGPVVNRNYIVGACGNTRNVGADLRSSWARLTNNVIRAGTCAAGGAAGGNFYGVRQVSEGASPPEPDVNSNSIDSGTFTFGSCTAQAVGIVVPATVVLPPIGIYRNNILRVPTGCGTRYGLSEANAGADPRVVENNDFFVEGGGVQTLYWDEGTTAITMPGSIDALTDMTASGSFSSDPLYLNWPNDMHIASTSPCRGVGTPTGAPTDDFDGQTRPQPAGTNPDVGADEVP